MSRRGSKEGGCCTSCRHYVRSNWGALHFISPRYDVLDNVKCYTVIEIIKDMAAWVVPAERFRNKFK